MTNQKPANPLDNQQAITQINAAINFLITEFIRPGAQQTIVNQQLIESNARAIQANAESISKLRADGRELHESLRVTARVADDTAQESSDHEKRFDALLTDLRQERQEWRSEAAINRTEWQASFAAQMSEIRALGEQNRALLSALAKTNSRVDALEQAS